MGSEPPGAIQEKTIGVGRDSNPGRLINSLTLYPLCHRAPNFNYWNDDLHISKIELKLIDTARMECKIALRIVREIKLIHFETFFFFQIESGTIN